MMVTYKHSSLFIRYNHYIYDNQFLFCVTVSTGARMSELDILPNELIVCILRWLGARDLTRVALTCTRLHALTRLDTLWQRLCEQGV